GHGHLHLCAGLAEPAQQFGRLVRGDAAAYAQQQALSAQAASGWHRQESPTPDPADSLPDGGRPAGCAGRSGSVAIVPCWRPGRPRADGLSPVRWSAAAGRQRLRDEEPIDAHPRLAGPRTPARKTACPGRRRPLRRRAAGDLPGLGPARPGRGGHRAPAARAPRPAAAPAGARATRDGAPAGARPGARQPAGGRAGTGQPLAGGRARARPGADRSGLGRPLLRPAPAGAADRGVRGPVPGHPPPRARVRGTVPRHHRRRRGASARSGAACAGAQRRRGDRGPQPPEREPRAQRRRPRGHRPAQAVAGAGGRAPARPFRDRRWRAGVAGGARLGLTVPGGVRPRPGRGRHGRTRGAPRTGKMGGLTCAQTPVKSQLRGLIEQAIAALRDAGTLPADLATPDFVVERPKDRAHGDFSTNAAMLLARPAKSNPRALAQALVDALPRGDDIAAVEIAGPGFLNFRLSPGAWGRQLAPVHAQGAAYGRNDSGGGRTAGVEYVSANPTGPLHVGHGRAGAIGDCIARVLEANGWDVRREFYYNDAGVQINNLALSTQARARGYRPGDPQWPADAYNGDYIADVAAAYLRGESVEVDGHVVTGKDDADDLEAIRQFAVAYLRREQNADLAAFGVTFDVYFLE